MTSYYIKVNGIPKGQPRARATIRGKHAGVYDPGTANDWKALVVQAARTQKPASPLEGPLSVSVTLYFPRPARLCRKKDLGTMVRHTGKPDFDNCAKAIVDCLMQDGWMRDDGQVCHAAVWKWYAPVGSASGAEIVLETL